MLALACRALLVFLLSESVETDRTAPFLITENIPPRNCVLDCQLGRHRAVCGSNGRLYKSQCAFQRAQCINTQLRPVPRAHCADRLQTKCQQARAQGLEARAHSGDSHVSSKVAIFVPECSPEGHFLPIQCYNYTGYCWCSTPDGKPVSDTAGLNVIPNCTDHLTTLVRITDTDLDPNKDGEDKPEPTLNPTKPAELTAPPLLVTILRKPNRKGNRSLRRRAESLRTCERERAFLLSKRDPDWEQERFIPECTSDGRYSPVQCYTPQSYCWCVRVDSGRPIPGSAVRHHIPDCLGAGKASTEKPLPGCPGAHRKQFLQSLIRALQLQAEHSGSLSSYRDSNTNPSNSASPSSNTPPSLSSFSSPLTDAPSAAPEAEKSLAPELWLPWRFIQLDLDSNGWLSERETRPLRHFLRRTLKPRRCAKKFAQYCDRNRDRGLTLEELRVCLAL